MRIGVVFVMIRKDQEGIGIYFEFLNKIVKNLFDIKDIMMQLIEISRKPNEIG